MPNNQKGFAPVILIVVVVLILALGGGGYYLYSKNQTTKASTNSTKEDTSKENNETPKTDNYNFVYKEINEFFPETLSNLPIIKISINNKNYAIAQTIDTKLQLESDQNKTAALLERSFAADYGDKEKTNRNIQLIYQKFTNKQETEDAKILMDEVFNTLNSTQRKINIRVPRGFMVWAWYSEVPADKVTEYRSADIRMLDVDSNTLLRISTYGGYRETELQGVVDNYLNALKDSSTKYVPYDQIMTESIRKEIFYDNKVEQMNKEFDERSQQMMNDINSR